LNSGELDAIISCDFLLLFVIPPVADAVSSDLNADAREAAAVQLAGLVLHELLEAVA
jgi:hypothetical protein